MEKKNNWDPDAMPTIWEVPDELWEIVAAILATLDPPKRTGRPRRDARTILNAIIFRMRTGCQWNHLPKQFGDDSTVHRTFQHWVKFGVFERIWTVVQNSCEELGGVNWEWQAADGLLRKSRSGGTKLVPIRPIVARMG